MVPEPDPGDRAHGVRNGCGKRAEQDPVSLRDGAVQNALSVTLGKGLVFGCSACFGGRAYAR